MSVTKIDRYAGSSIQSIFGQIEEVVASAMISEGKARLIPVEIFPDEKMCPDVHVNDLGQRAKFAVQLSKLQLLEFNRRVDALRM